MRPTGSRETGAASAAECVEEPTCLEGALAGALGGSVTEAGAGDSGGSEEVGVAGIYSLVQDPSVWRQWCGEERCGQRFAIGKSVLGL